MRFVHDQPSVHGAREPEDRRASCLSTTSTPSRPCSRTRRQATGYAVVRARWSRGARPASRKRFDLVVLDMMLPKLDIEVCCGCSQVPMIMLTAKDDEIDKVLGLEMGANDYIKRIGARVPQRQGRVAALRDARVTGERRGELILSPEFEIDFDAGGETSPASRRGSLTSSSRPGDARGGTLQGDKHGFQAGRLRLPRSAYIDVHIRQLREKLEALTRVVPQYLLTAGRSATASATKNELRPQPPRAGAPRDHRGGCRVSIYTLGRTQPRPASCRRSCAVEGGCRRREPRGWQKVMRAEFP